MIFKDHDRHVKEIFELTSNTLLILADVNNWCKRRGIDPVFTCFLRTEAERKDLVRRGLSEDKVGVHELGRGFDVRPLIQNELNQQLMDYINQKYVYDPTRPAKRTVIRHKGTKDHLHFQSLT